MKKRLLILITAIALIVAQQALPAFAGENSYTQVLFPIEDQWSEGPSFSKGKTNTGENSDYYYYELYPEQIMEANHFSLGGLPFDLAMLYPEIDLSDEEFEDEPMLKGPPGEGDPISGVTGSPAPLNDGLAFLLLFSVLFISYKFLNNTHTMKTSSSRAKREISRSTMEFSTSLRPQSGKQSSEKNRKLRIASSFLLAMTLLLSTSNLQAQTLKAHPVNKFVPNDQWYSWSKADGGTDAFTGATINVLENDELGVCRYEENVIVTITQEPTKGTAVVIGDNDANGLTKNRILYTVKHDGKKNFTETGQDVLYYTVTCGTTTSEPVKVLINIVDQPDNIVWDGCFIKPKVIEWGMKNTGASSRNVHVVSTPFAGDLDGDNIPEVVAPYSIGDYSTGICIFNNDLQLIKQFSTPTMYDYGTTTLLIADVDNDGYGEIVIAARYTGNGTNAARLICYDRNGNRKWTSDQPYATSDVGPSLIIADIDGDGKAEIMANNKIFAAESGKLLVTLPAGGVGLSPGGPASSMMPAFADLNNDGKMEVIAGNTTYTVTINNREGTTDNTAVILAQATGMPDGFTSIADINNDGLLDVVVTSSRKALEVFIYAWEGINSNVIGTISVATTTVDSRRVSRAFVGDITGDGQADIAFTCVKKMCAYTYKDGVFEELWTLPTTDTSGATGVTMFDFNQDGISELIYRDETALRIINGSGIHHETGAITGPYNLVSTPCYSGTHTEYPIVVDVDNNGSACILVSGRLSSTSDKYAATVILKYESNTSDQWAWARPVWNQHAYNPVYINDDLTIPTHPMNPATVFVDKEGKEHRPYNNFLQQATLLNNEGLMFEYGPDLLFDPMEGEYGSGVIYTENGENLDVTIYVLNQGDADFLSPLQVSAYKIDAGSLSSVYTGSFDITIEKADTKVVSFSIPLSDLSAGINPYTDIQLRLNDKDFSLDTDPPTPIGEEECRYYNNYYPSGLYIALPEVACEGEDVTLQIYPQDGIYTYKWYKTPISTTVLSETYTCTVKKDNSQLQTLYVDVYHGETLITSEGRYEVKLYSRPKELVWTGAAGNHDWHNTGNWYEPAEVTPKTYLIPRKCTNVLIPDGLSYYPDLSETTYTTFAEAQCADIRFEFGGEVARTDLLNYDRAFVQYNFGYYKDQADGSVSKVVKQGYVTEKGGSSYTPSYMARDRYYALSAPLNKMVTGDFNVGGKPNTWQQTFVATQGESDWVGNFKAPANTNDIELNEDLGYAISLWIAGDNDGEMGEDRDLHDGYQSSLDGLEGIIEIPYFENEEVSKLHRLHKYDKGSSYFYYYYYQQPNFPIAPNTPGSIARADEAYRFIFDKKVTADGKFTIPAPAGSEVMIGNPTLSTMDFDAFYIANTDKMENYYRLFEGETFSTIYAPSGDPAKTAPIAPMQAFFLKTKGTAGGIVDLVYPFETASVTRTTDADHGLRSATDEDCHCGLDRNCEAIDLAQSPDNRRGSRIKSGMTDGTTMQIKAEQAGYTSQISLVLNEPERKNIEQLFYRYADNTPQLYLKDEAGKRNAVQFEGKGEKEIPLGIQFEKTTAVTLSFNNIEDLPLETLSLVDTKTGTETDLLKTNSYTFTHDADGERFVLRVGRLRNVTGIDEFDTEAALNVYPEGNRIIVSSNQSIASVEVYDTQGRLIIKQTTTDGLIINDSGIYIVRVTLANGERKAVKVTL